jgi:hypothetical protein
MLEVPQGLDPATVADIRQRATRVLLEIVAERKLTDLELLALSAATTHLPHDARLTDVNVAVAQPVGEDRGALVEAGRTLLAPLTRLTRPGSSFARLLDHPSSVTFDPDAPLCVVRLGDLEVTSDLRECVSRSRGTLRWSR